jgi:hypothetical protein
MCQGRRKVSDFKLAVARLLVIEQRKTDSAATKENVYMYRRDARQ